jgi:hypothetical protein
MSRIIKAIKSLLRELASVLGWELWGLTTRSVAEAATEIALDVPQYPVSDLK